VPSRHLIEWVPNPISLKPVEELELNPRVSRVIGNLKEGAAVIQPRTKCEVVVAGRVRESAQNGRSVNAGMHDT
jgi:hypothetical protein